MSQEDAIHPRPQPQPKKESEDFTRPRPRPRSERPDFDEPELEPVFGQHIRLLDVEKSEGRVICECWYCKEGVLIQHQREPQQEEIRVTCPHCGRVAIKLQIAKIMSVIAIPSPWSRNQ
ncbi:hypothetical protein WA1_14860 [Scytonema hofmannii PCC 7110]|uniref:Uncharacterized protein n=1 Tax=Scytonema hofmannii PCC 7110 TaxID=128403 RepID=A0A139XD85_9CYAN|nr:hypothetical protein [Scytonema hofmannii]KYC42626.1 hypothetical protein WA1_14860 [Scytonema hofmannii PCC 7110]